MYRDRQKERENEGETESERGEREIDSAISRHKSLRPLIKKVPEREKERETESRDPDWKRRTEIQRPSTKSRDVYWKPDCLIVDLHAHTHTYVSSLGVLAGTAVYS